MRCSQYRHGGTLPPQVHTASALPDLDCSAVPYFPNGVRLYQDPLRGRQMLLAPGQAMALDAVCSAILVEIDGDSSLSQILATLSARYRAPDHAPGECISQDVKAVLRDFIDDCLIALRPGHGDRHAA